MGNSSSFISGPLVSGNVILIGIDNQGTLYVLRSDPGSGFIPYFGQVNATNSGNFLSLNLTANNVNPPTYTLLSGSNAFVQTDADGLIQLVPGSGDFNYEFVTLSAGGTAVSANISPGTPLVGNLLTNLSVNGITLKFPYKSPTQEATDTNNANSSFYLPTYDGTISNVIIIPAVTYPIGNCTSINTNGAYSDLVSNTQTYSNYFTTSAWCQSGILVPANFPFCTGGAACGTTSSSTNGGTGTNSSGNPCFGPCSTDICGPSDSSTSATLVCTDSSSIDDLSTTVILIIVGIIALIILGGIVFAITR